MSAASALMLDSFPIHGWPATHGDKSEAPATRNVLTAVVSFSRSRRAARDHVIDLFIPKPGRA
jgi:hypothetical protein